MATLIKVFTKNPEDDWSGIIHGKQIVQNNPDHELSELAPLANSNIATVRTLNATYSSQQYSNNEWRVSYNFDTIGQLVLFVVQYSANPQVQTWKAKANETAETKALPRYTKNILILDNDGNEVAHNTLFSNTAILKTI